MCVLCLGAALKTMELSVQSRFLCVSYRYLE
jgi:hypothetical protein